VIFGLDIFGLCCLEGCWGEIFLVLVVYEKVVGEVNFGEEVLWLKK